MNALLVFLAIGALGLALLTASCAAVAVRRARASADDLVAAAVQNLAAGVEGIVRDLAEAFETAQAALRAEPLAEPTDPPPRP